MRWLGKEGVYFEGKLILVSILCMKAGKSTKKMIILGSLICKLLLYQLPNVCEANREANCKA